MSRDPLLVDHPPEKDWKVLECEDMGPGNYYRYRVIGLNLNWKPEAADYRFSWSVPRIDDPRFDMSEAVKTCRAPWRRFGEDR